MSTREALLEFYRLIPLDKQKKEIRLLQLSFIHGTTVNTEEPIRGKLVKARLLDPPNYNALSYTWGAQEFPRQISLTLPTHGHGSEEIVFQIAITENLYAALILYGLLAPHKTRRVSWT